MARRTWSTAFVGVLLLGGSALPSTAAHAATPVPEQRATAARATATLTTGQFETQLLGLVNARRKKIGCAQLKPNAALIKAARTHSSLMVKRNNLSHQLPGELGLAARIVKAGYGRWNALAENISWGAASPARVYGLWMNSAGHRANIQHCGYRDGGVGVVRGAGSTWVTLDFGRHR